MSTPLKDNAHILSNQQAFQEACARAREFFGQIEGVADVGFGQKETGGQYQEDIAIIVFVWEKKKSEELTPEQRIPPMFEGYKTDVVVVPIGAPLVCDNSNKYDTIVGGIRIEPPIKSIHPNVPFGTLGCIVRRRADAGRENVYLLTCQHVLYTHESGENDYAYQPIAPPPPGAHDRPGVERTSLGPIQKAAFRENIRDYTYTIVDPATQQQTTKKDDFFIDCATARINIDCKCLDSTCTKDVIKYDVFITDLQINNKNDIDDVRSVIESAEILGQKVYKVGATTGRTVGIVRWVHVPVNVLSDPENPNSPLFPARNMIAIDFDETSTETHKNCKEHAWFAEPGDSGSIVLDEQRRAIGLLAIGPPDKLPNGQPTPNAWPTFACHILPVLDKLNICIPTTTGTSHGSSRATDGSGIAPTALSAANSTLPAGQIVFTAQDVEAVPTSSPGLTEPVPVTDDEERHMRELLDAFRSTQKGRELHDVFGEVRREIGYLVRNCRPVKVAWHRNKGPAFLAHVLNHLKGYTDHVPLEVDGVPRSTLLTRMRDVLSKYGSHPLRQAIEQYGDDLIVMLTSGTCNCAQDCIAYLQEKESP